MDSKSNSEFAAPSPGSISAHRGKLTLPASCEPPLPNSPRKQLVWIVRLMSPSTRLRILSAMLTVKNRSSGAPATWAGHW